MLAEMMLTMGWGSPFDFDNPFSGALPLYDLYLHPPFYGEGFAKSFRPRFIAFRLNFFSNFFLVFLFEKTSFNF